MTTPATALVSPGADAATDFTSFIEVQLPVSKLSKECYQKAASRPQEPRRHTGLS